MPNPSGTVSGNVRTSMGTPVAGRQVSAIDVSTGAHYDVATSASGGFTIKVPTGRYRLEVELVGSELIATQPAPMNVSGGDVDEQLDFVIGR